MTPLGKIIPIVEGAGDAMSVTMVIKKLLKHRIEDKLIIGHPKQANGKTNLTKRGGLEKFISYIEREQYGDHSITDREGVWKSSPNNKSYKPVE